MPAQWNVSAHHLMLGVPELWSKGIVGKGITVAVLDTGLAAPRGLDRSDFEYLDGNGTAAVSSDPSGHGTAAGSLIASYWGGALGIAPFVKLVSLRVIETADSAERIEAAFSYLLEQRADVDIVSCSFVIPRVSEKLRETARRLAQSGRLIVAAAGDDSAPMDFPEQTSNVLTVAAVDGNRRPLPGARRGPWIDVAAPGFELPVVLPGTARIGRFSLSSAAAAVVSGVAALVLSAVPERSRRAIGSGLEGAFRSTAEQLTGEDPDAVGRGLIQPRALLAAIQAHPAVNDAVQPVERNA